MANDVTWWKDRDKWMPGVGSEPAPHHELEEEEDLPGEDAGTFADDESEELDDPDLPDRGADN